MGPEHHRGPYGPKGPVGPRGPHKYEGPKDSWDGPYDGPNDGPYDGPYDGPSKGPKGPYPGPEKKGDDAICILVSFDEYVDHGEKIGKVIFKGRGHGRVDVRLKVDDDYLREYEEYEQFDLYIGTYGDLSS
jgi:hypothetical protein